MTAKGDRLFDTVFVRAPSEDYLNCVSSNPLRERIDITLAREQHQNYVSVLKESDVDVVQLECLNSKPDSVFMQDPAILGRRRSLIGRFGEPRRRGEEEAFLNELKLSHANEVGMIGRIESPGTLEGGDIVVTNHELFVGESSRTNWSGIDQMTRWFRDMKVTPVKTNLLHLLCGCSYLSKDTIIIAPELVNVDAFSGFHLITISKEDAYAADALYVGEDRVIIPDGFQRVRRKLTSVGFKPIEVETSEFYKGDGGVTCLSSPIYEFT